MVRGGCEVVRAGVTRRPSAVGGVWVEAVDRLKQIVASLDRSPLGRSTPRWSSGCGSYSAKA